MPSDEHDLRYHTQNMHRRLSELVKHLRSDIEKVYEPSSRLCSRPPPRC
jgi:hypothetical protein